MSQMKLFSFSAWQL